MLNTSFKNGLLLAAIIGSAATNAIPTVTVDGVLEAGEYLGGTQGLDYGTINLPWYNDHHSIYDLDAGLSNDLHWEISGTGSEYNLNVFFEVPGYARRMIWDNGCDYEAGNTIAEAGCTDLSNALQADGLTEEEVTAALDAYKNNHHGHANMSFSTQTGSEEFELETFGGDTIFMTDWDGSEEDLGDNYVDHATSLDWLLDNDVCDTSFCDAWEVTASIEVQWQFGTRDATNAFLGDLGRMRLHLSDEARGLPVLTSVPTPPTSVSEPGSLALLSLGLAALGWARRKAA
ncbi:PEP-CTERM sorting domain-containing protein [Oceanicoccus sagamiensis]|uniref:Ice-binding protein C-terminal domain-containing protein n=1 Tax=Oceanicoccus sagamiensis TaxID=716816 RepID=A0A1X9NAS0_9GAMM|nr:PEP-CTERM sorting domain-containing protein [Oceanicoccus sagamiensis]ARN72639.1 hypothetical protein BST96_00030 [Oceanicoccus sagamiensis]ARN76233.1 hypothetical protein BST96_20270 [Oceanicoccus sagamiensis]